jgi:hypothetical protein
MRALCRVVCTMQFVRGCVAVGGARQGIFRRKRGWCEAQVASAPLHCDHAGLLGRCYHPPALSVAMPLGVWFLANIPCPVGVACSVRYGLSSSRSEPSGGAAPHVCRSAQPPAHQAALANVHGAGNAHHRSTQHRRSWLCAAPWRALGDLACIWQRLATALDSVLALPAHSTAQHANEAGDRRERIGSKGLCGTLCGRFSITNTCTHFFTL